MSLMTFNKARRLQQVEAMKPENIEKSQSLENKRIDEKSIVPDEVPIVPNEPIEEEKPKRKSRKN